MSRRIVVFVCLILFTFTLSALGQQQGAITGVVTDPQGAVIPGAKVTATNTATNKTYEVTTSGNGSYTIPGVPAGVYTVSVEAIGFRTWQGPNVRVITAQGAIVNPAMEVGEVTETITVESSQELVETATVELQTNISKKQLKDLPLLGRSPMSLISSIPGVSFVSSGSRNAHVNGTRGTSTNITQDGINAMDNFVKTGGFFALNSPTVESTAEFSISTSNIDSDSGFGMVQVRMTTPRGGNDVHGSLFYFHRNDKFNAATFFDNLNQIDKEREREHRFGGDAGGPLRIPGVYDGRDKSFWWFRYDGFRENAATTRNRTVLTAPARQGLYSYIVGGAVQQIDLLNASTRGLGLNPFTMSLINATPLPNNTSVGDCAGRTDPAASLAAGECNTAGHTFSVTESATRDRYSFRADQQVVNSDTFGEHWVEVVYSFVDFSNSPDTFNSLDARFPEGVAVSCVGGLCEGSSQTSERKMLATAIHSTFSATLFNEARFGFNRAPVGFTRDNAFPRDFQVDFTSITDPESNFLSQGRLTPVYQFNENLTKVAGNHTIKTGFTVMSVSGISFNDGGIIPQVDLGSNSTNDHGLPCSDPSSSDPLVCIFPGLGIGSGDITRARNVYIDLVGLINDTDQTFNGTPGNSTFTPGASNELFMRERSFGFYLTDSWRVRPGLTLNFGMRYEIVKPVDMVNRRAVIPVGGQDGLFITGSESSLFKTDPSITIGDFLSGAANPPLLIPAGTSNGVPFWDTDWNNFAPSFGFAWSATPKTVLRGGGSMSYTRNGLTLVSGPLGSNTGLRQGLSINNFQMGFDTLDPSRNIGITAPPLAPTFNQITNFINGSSGMFTFDPDLRTPYVIQWSFGIQRELDAATAVEIRYVGNHGVKLARALDFDQIDIMSNGLLNEFALAQQNLACNGGGTFENLGTACNVAMPVLDALQLRTDGVINLYASSGRRTDLGRDQAGQFWHAIADDCTFFRFAFDGVFGPGNNICPGLDAFPANFFRANPFGFLMDSVGNHSRSTHHAVQAIIRRRFSGGLQFDANYTFGKTLTDFSGDVQNEFEPFLDMRNRGFDRRRANFDLKHNFNANGVYEIPMGTGRAVVSEGPLGKILEGWQVGFISNIYSGSPLGIFSNRGTLNRNGRSSNRNTATLVGTTTFDDVCNAIDVYKEDGGVFFLPPEFRASNGQAADTIFGHPKAGQLGVQGLRRGCSRPGGFALDMNLVKRTTFSESGYVELRFEFFNILNHPVFQTGSNNSITSGSFSRINNLAGTDSRQIQFNLRIQF